MTAAGRPRHRGRLVALAAALAGLGVLPALCAGTTSAAWTDPATMSATVTAGRWALPGGGAVLPADPTTLVTSLSWSVIDVAQLCVAVTVTTTSNDPVEWHARVAYEASPFRGDTVMGHYVLEGDNGWVERLDNTPAPGLIQFHGVQQTWSTRRMLSLRTDDVFPSSVTFTLCNRNLPSPLDDPTLTYQATMSPLPTNPHQACVDVTVGVTSPTYPFYVGWHGDVDLTGLLNLRRGAGLSTDVSVRSGGAQVVRLHDDVYRLTSNAVYTAGVRSAGGSDAAVTRTSTVCAG